MNQSTLAKRFSVCLIAGAVIAAALPPATAFMQTDSPLPTAAPVATPQPATRPSRPAVPPKITTQVLQEVTTTLPIYAIDVKYPMAPPEGNNNTFNRLAREQVDGVIAAFKKDLAASDIVTDVAYITNSLNIDYRIIRNLKGIISTRFSNGIYFAGAAHPNTFSSVLNFDLNTGQPITLAEVFKPDVDYLSILSNYCKRVLQRRGVLDFPEGADPKPENYQNWNMGRYNLVITYDAYQVAPYALGPQECQVPLVFLRRHLADPRRW